MPLTKITSGEFQDSSVSFSGIVTAGSLSVSAGPVLIGSATSTGTAAQRLQVTGGGYFSGNLGVGFTNPTNRLQVFGNAIVSGAVGVATTNPIQPFQVGAGSTIVVVDNMGDLGIGITNPTSKLQVVGDARVSGVVTAFDFYNDAEYPSVRPTLDLSFAQTKILDSRIIFTRASTATYTNSSKIIQSAAINEARFDHDPATGESLGLLIEEARTNSYQYGSNFDNSYWTKSQVSVIPNNGLAPDGTITASKIVPDTANVTTHYITKDRGAGNPATETFTIYAKAAGYSYLLVVSTDTNNQFRVNLNDGSIDSKGATVVSSSTVSTQSVGNGWWRVTYSVSSNQLRYISLIPVPQTITSYTQSFSGDGISGVLIWGAQVEAGSFPTSYIPTPATFTSRASTATFYNSTGLVGTATTDQARSDAFFPDSDGAIRPVGLLLEAAGTNLTPRSQDFTSGWTSSPNFNTVSGDVTTAPDGTTTADLISETANNSSFYANRSDVSVTSGTTYTFSVFLKKGPGATAPNWIGLGLNAAGFPPNTTASFNLTTGSLGQKESNIISYGITKLPNGWYRCHITAVSDETTGSSSGVIIFTNNQNTAGFPSYAGKTTSNVYAWGAQLEASPYPTSYIPTVASTVTRAADISSSATVTRSADVATINADLNLDAATIRSSFYLPSYSSITNSALNYKPILCFDNTANQRFELGIEGANPSIISIASSLTMQDAVIPKQNLISVSSGAGVSGFTTTGGYIAQLSLADANGGTDAFLFIDNATDPSYHHVGTAITTGGFSTNFVHVVSVYAKKYNTDYVFLQATDTGNRSANAVFDLSNPGPATQFAAGTFGTIISTGMIDCGNDWYRLYIVFIIGSVAPVALVRFGPAAVGVGNTIFGAGLQYASAGYGVYFANPQIERSTVIGKYIPTTSGAVTSTYYNSVLRNKSSSIIYSYNNLNNNTGVSFDGRTPANASRRFLLRNTTFRLGSDILGNRLNGCIKGISYYPEALSNNVLQTITL